MKRPGDADQILREVGEDAPVVRFVGIGQRGPRHLAAKAHMIQLASNPDTLRCLAGFRGKSTARRPSKDIDPNKRNYGDDCYRHSGSHIFGTPCEGDERSTLRTRTGQYASSIVSWSADSLAAPILAILDFKSFPPQKAAIHNGRKGLREFAKYFTGH